MAEAELASGALSEVRIAPPDGGEQEPLANEASAGEAATPSVEVAPSLGEEAQAPAEGDAAPADGAAAAPPAPVEVATSIEETALSNSEIAPAGAAEEAGQEVTAPYKEAAPAVAAEEVSGSTDEMAIEAAAREETATVSVVEIAPAISNKEASAPTDHVAPSVAEEAATPAEDAAAAHEEIAPAAATAEVAAQEAVAPEEEAAVPKEEAAAPDQETALVSAAEKIATPAEGAAARYEDIAPALAAEEVAAEEAAPSEEEVAAPEVEASSLVVETTLAGGEPASPTEDVVPSVAEDAPAPAEGAPAPTEEIAVAPAADGVAPPEEEAATPTAENAPATAAEKAVGPIEAPPLPDKAADLVAEESAATTVEKNAATTFPERISLVAKEAVAQPPEDASFDKVVAEIAVLPPDRSAFRSAFPPGRIRTGLVSPDSARSVSRPATPVSPSPNPWESTPNVEAPHAKRTSVTFAEDPAVQSRRSVPPMPLRVDARSIRPKEDVRCEAEQACDDRDDLSAPSFWPPSRDVLMAALGKTWPPTNAGGGKTCIGPGRPPPKLRSPRSAMGEVYLQGSSVQQWVTGTVVEGSESMASTTSLHRHLVPQAPLLAEADEPVAEAADVSTAVEVSGLAAAEMSGAVAAAVSEAAASGSSGTAAAEMSEAAAAEGPPESMRALIPPDSSSSSSRPQTGQTRPGSVRTLPDSGRTGNEQAAAVKEPKKRPWPRPPLRPRVTKAPPPRGGAPLPSLLRFGHGGMKPVTPPPSLMNFQFPHARVAEQHEADASAESVAKDLAQECKVESEAAVRREEESCNYVLPKVETREVALQTDAAACEQLVQPNAKAEALGHVALATTSNRQVVMKRCDWRHVDTHQWTLIRPPEKVLSEEMRYTFHVQSRFPGALDRAVCQGGHAKPTLQLYARSRGPGKKWNV